MKAFATAALLALVTGTMALADPIYPNSVVSNDHEFIRTDDPSAFACIGYKGTSRQEMPDKRGGDLFADGVHTFEANYADGTSVQVWVHPHVGSQDRAQTYATHVAEAVGKLPTMMRNTLRHVVVHEGDESAFGESEGHFFVLYSRNIDTRLSNHDLEETVFHESVHATLDSAHLGSSAWQKAQRKDGAFVTEYAERLPEKEDMAESGLFAWAILQHPGRLPADIEARVREVMPNRLSFFEDLFGSKPLFYEIGSPKGC